MSNSQILLYLDTKDSITPNTPADTSFALKALLRDDAFKTIGLKSVTFANVLFAVNSNTNTLVFQEDGAGTDFTATLTVGNYSATTLATEIKTQMDSAGANTYTVTYDASTFKYTIATSGTSIRLLDTSTCLEVIGFTAQDAFVATSTTSDLVARLDGPQYVSIISNLNSMNISSNSYSNIMERVPISTAIGDLITYEPSEVTYQAFHTGTLDNLALRLYDDRDVCVCLPANCPIQYIFSLQR